MVECTAPPPQGGVDIGAQLQRALEGSVQSAVPAALEACRTAVGVDVEERAIRALGALCPAGMEDAPRETAAAIVAEVAGARAHSHVAAAVPLMVRRQLVAHAQHLVKLAARGRLPPGELEQGVRE